MTNNYLSRGEAMVRKFTGLGMALLAIASAACDFEVTNPGPTPDDFLDKPEAHQAIANGAARLLYDGLNEVVYTTSAVVRELFPAGSTSAFGISNRQQVGRLEYDDEHIEWTSHQSARYVAESGFARFEANVPAGLTGYRPAVEAALWAGYANRLLGENWCEAVIDGGGIEPRTVFLTRAEQWFTRTMELAGTTASLANVAMAARAGRASVRVHLGNWEGAVADAGGVPTDFRFQAQYHITQQTHYNRLYFAGASRPYRAVTVWNTFYDGYFTETADPRTPWALLAGFPEGDASIAFLGGKVPFHQQRKYVNEADDINLSSGYEMRLIEIEAQLRAGNWQQGIDALNARRVALNLQPWPATNETEAWTVFKRERGIELWLEGRRLGDLRRWQETSTPGDLHPLEQAGNALSYIRADQSLCYAIPKSEREANPNIPINPGT